jgi:enamine deaminase RidA (YjgF/YER057c/UK114 family)
MTSHTFGLPMGLMLLTVALAGCAQTQPPVHDSQASAPSIKETRSLNTSWEKEWGFVQGTKGGGLIFLAGQLSLDEKGQIGGKGNMEAQMRQAYANVSKALQEFHVTMNDVLEETLYVTDMPTALTAGPKVRREVYAAHPDVASTLVQSQRLAFADALVEIRVIAKAPAIATPRSSDAPSTDSRRRGGRGRGGSLGGSLPF